MRTHNSPIYTGSTSQAYPATSSNPQLQDDPAAIVHLPHDTYTGESSDMTTLRQRLDAYKSQIHLPQQPKHWSLMEKIRSSVKGPVDPAKVSSSEVKQFLKGWAQEAVQAGDTELADARKTAAKQISKLLDGKSDILKLQTTKLDNLPDIFDHPAIARQLRHIDISNCKNLTELPASMLRLPKLHLLSVNRCPISRLPEFGDMPALRSLFLSGNQLKDLPESIGQLTNLKTLDLANNQISKLPESIGKLSQLNELKVNDNALRKLPDSIGQLTQLTSVDLCKNQLTSLPESIAELSKLQSLYLINNYFKVLPDCITCLPVLEALTISNNTPGRSISIPDTIGALPLTSLSFRNADFTELPEAITAMKTLKKLYLPYSRLTDLPASIGNLTGLTDLELYGSENLTLLPKELASLPALRNIDLEGCPLAPRSQHVVDKMVETRQDNKANIRFSILPPPYLQFIPKRLLHHAVDRWLALSPEQHEQWSQLGQNRNHDEVDAREFNSWLTRMEYVKDYDHSHTRLQLMTRMDKLLSAMNQALMTSGQQALSPFLAIAHEATASCTDRITVGLNNMELELVSQQAESGALNVNELTALAREMFVTDQTREFANNKVRELRQQGKNDIDEIEVHLAYQVGLKQQLQLTLGSQDMTFSDLSMVTTEDIQTAADQIRQQLSDPDQMLAHYAQWTPLHKYVERAHADELQAIKDKLDTLADEALDAGDWAALEALKPQREHMLNDFYASKIKELL